MLLSEFLNVSELKRSFRAAFHTDGHEPPGGSRDTPVALTHLAGGLIKLRYAVGARRRAHAATDAFGGVDHNKAVFLAFEVRLCGTDLHARRISALIAPDMGFHP